MTVGATQHSRGITVSIGPRLVLDEIDLTVAPGHRVGLIGPNGVGKSTLLRALAGVQPLDAGSVQLLPPDATVGHLPQEPDRSATETVREFVRRRTGVGPAEDELEAATAALAVGADDADDRYSVALERWLALGGPELDGRLGAALDDLGIDAALLDRPTLALSGGEAARCGLAALSLSRFDLYLLDEPTNDLDLDGLTRLERWIEAVPAGVVLVSHDREFLRRIVTHVVELDEFSHRASAVAGGWEAYVAAREVARRHAWERFDQYSTRRSELADRTQREREWATQGLRKARRQPDDGDKHVKAFKVNQTEQLAGRAARTERAIERLDVVEKPRELWQLRFSLAAAARSGDEVATLHGCVVERGGFRLGPIDLAIANGDRVAILGANGSGKTTLLDLVVGRRVPDIGECRLGSGVRVGEIAQARDQLSGEPTLLAAFMSATGMTVPDARTLLAKFGLTAEHVGRPTSSTSPGERTRAALALLMARGVNCLVLDEPTNHLDLPAIEQLETALEPFDGTLLLVTHDRALLDAVRLTRRIELRDGRVHRDVSV